MRIRQYTRSKTSLIAGKFLMFVSLLTLSLSSLALQQASPEDQSINAVASGEPAQPSTANNAQTDATVNASEILRLEQTIRANKEQPQVLTIVPWQLPTHQRINETKTWQPVVQKLPNIERSQFLRDLSVVDDILSAASDPRDKDE